MPRALLLTLAVATLALALVLALVLGGDGGTNTGAPSTPADHSAPVPDATDLELARIASELRAASEVEQAPPQVQAPSPQAAPGPDGRLESWLLAGRVVEADGQAPRSDRIVALHGLESVQVDRQGRFQLRVPNALAQSGDTGSMSVHDLTGEVLLRSLVRLEPAMELRLVPVQVLRGQVVDTSGLPLAVSSVMAYLPPQGLREIERYLGGSLTVDGAGGFELPVPREIELPLEVMLRVGFHETFFPFEAARDALLSDEGVTLVLDVCTFQVRVTGVTEPVTFRPEVRLAAWIDEDVDSAVLSFLRPDESGIIEVAVPSNATRIELGAGAEEHAPRIELRTSVPCGETWTVHLPAYGPGDVVSGEVLDAEGQPVENAFVSCNPITEHGEISVPAHQGVRTTSTGSFELPAVQGVPLELRAYEKAHGMTREHLVRGGTRGLVLRFEPVQVLSVSVLEGVADEAPEQASLHWGLAVEGGEGSTGQSSSHTFQVEQVPAGSHRLFVYDPERKRYGETLAEVFPGLQAQAQVTLREARRAQGQVVDAQGEPVAGVDVELHDAGWPRGFHATFGRARTNSTGAFHVLLDNGTAPSLNVWRGRDLLARLPVPEDGLLVLP